MRTPELQLQESHKKDTHNFADNTLKLISTLIASYQQKCTHLKRLKNHFWTSTFDPCLIQLSLKARKRINLTTITIWDNYSLIFWLNLFSLFVQPKGACFKKSNFFCFIFLFQKVKIMSHTKEQTLPTFSVDWIDFEHRTLTFCSFILYSLNRKKEAVLI